MKSKKSVKNWSNSLQNLKTQAWILLEFPKNRSFVTFPAMKKDFEVLWSQKLMRSKALTLEYRLDILNISLRRLENIVEAFEVEVIRQKIDQIHFKTLRLKLGFYLNFPKIVLLLLFLP